MSPVGIYPIRAHSSLFCFVLFCFINVALTLLLPNDSANVSVMLIFDEILVMSSHRSQTWKLLTF